MRIANHAPLIAIALMLVTAPARRAFPDEALLVRNGQPRADIVIAEDAPRSARLAAAELRTYVAKISGARLPLVTEPGADVPVHVYVGQSRYTELMGITAEGLEHGAYRIVSGDTWLVLIGDDTEFTPIEPWAKNNGDRLSGWLQREWEKLAGEAWGVPNSGMYKNRERLPGDIGMPDGAETGNGESMEIWGFDERGSFNAVCGYLRSLGVRWYMPGELGEVAPRMDSVPLPEIDETVRPDFEVRRFNIRFGTASNATMMWAMRLGIRNPYGLMVAHGMHHMTHIETILREHPEWFALYGGKRDTDPGERLNHLCYSNEELFRHTVRWARAQFDIYDFESVSIMPPDAYISICQCPLCEGAEVPEMGARGRLSNHVWDFVNRVANEVGKTHPDKKIVCCAYGPYTDPPTNIDKLEPNVQVVIVGGRRPRNSKPEQREPIRELREGWMAKTDTPLMIFENYPFTARGFYLPAFTARTLGESINATKGVSRGEDIWLSFGQDFDTEGIGFNHFQVYFTARMYWGGKEQDAAAMLDEYCRLFYGPAGGSMKQFFEYCEDNWQDMEHDKERVDAALQLFAAAQASVEPGSMYAKRLALIDEFLDALRSKSELLGQKRGPVPTLRMVWDAGNIVIDGKLDEPYWLECPSAATGRLRELQTGRQPILGTSVMAGWHHGNLYFAIRCDERAGETLNVATEKDEDPALWDGDAVEIELDTDSHSYYQIAMNPAGALADLDRGANKGNRYRWQSRAEVATYVASDHWVAEVRIPVTEDDNDPLNQVVGRKPSQSLPWHVNICRQRIRPNGSEYSALSPTGSKTFHEPAKFAHFYSGRSHKFDVDPTVTDYLIESRKAEELMRQGKRKEALAAFTALAAGDATDLQRSDALEKAAACARALRQFDRAMELADTAPIPAVANTVRMENLLGMRKPEEIVSRFGDEDIAAWPFLHAGQGHYLRGRAYAATGKGQQAEQDLTAALELIPDHRAKMNVWLTLGANRENNLEDMPAALEAYQQIAEAPRNTGSATYYRGVQGAARVLRQTGRPDDALAVLRKVDIAALRGYWHGSMLVALAQTLAAADRNEEALAAYREVLMDEKVSDADKRAAEEALTPAATPTAK